ncbi:MAG: hypothetical protein ACT4OS_03395 [Acidimicrobiales bacterium]
MENPEDPTVSAVVKVKGSPDPLALGKIKTGFSALGFEVHAPLGAMFSIGARRSVFERVFEATLSIDESSLAAAVTLADGGVDLPLAPLSDEVRVQVESVAFMPPPAFPMDFASAN